MTETPLVVAPVQQVVVPKHYIETSEGRKTWAMYFLVGGGIAMTLYACWALWLVETQPRYAFYLGLSAMAQLLLIFTGILGLIVRRTVNISRSGIIIEDHDSKD